MSTDLLGQFEFLLRSIGVTLSLFFGVFLLITYDGEGLSGRREGRCQAIAKLVNGR